MKFDKLSLFADGKTVPATANGVTYSKVLDLRSCGQAGIDGLLRIWAGIVGALGAADARKITTKLQTSPDGTTWTEVVSETQDGRSLMGIFLPCKGLKRYIRLTFTVGGTALGAAVTVKAGLVDQFDIDDLPTVPDFPTAVGAHGLADGIGIADALDKPLVAAETSKTIAKGSNADVAVSGGYIVDKTAPDKYTLTVTQGVKVNIALAAGAASGNVVLVDGLGNKVTIAVTAGS